MRQQRGERRPAGLAAHGQGGNRPGAPRRSNGSAAATQQRLRSRDGARDRPIAAVCIGASAGGVEALTLILGALPASFALPVFVVQHLPRDRPSLLADILGPRCKRPVREAQDKESVEPGVVYIAPPDYHMLIDAGPVISLSVDELVNFSRPAIDVLFESAADVYGATLLGVVLTGANDDGAAGLAAILRAGGAAVVQDPATALATAMPDAALRLSPGAWKMPLHAIPALLAQLPQLPALSEPPEGSPSW